MTDSYCKTDIEPSPPPPSWSWPVVIKRLVIWSAFLVVLRVTRDFFFIGFMTFLFSYLALTTLGWALNRLAPNRDLPLLRRLLTIAIFLLAPFALLVFGSIIGPRLISQVQHLASWVSQISPSTASTKFLEDWIGPYEFKQAYQGPDDPKYRKDLEAFRGSGQQHVQAYHDFPALEAWVEGAFRKDFADAEAARVRTRLEAEGTSSAEFERWFLSKKLSDLQEQARRRPPHESTADLSPLMRAAATESPEQVLILVRRDSALLALYRAEWIQDAVERGQHVAKSSTEYQQQLRRVYDEVRLRRPDDVPYDFDQYLELQKIRPQGPVAFGQALQKIKPRASDDVVATIKADFEAAKKHELFQQWWTTNPFAKFLRTQAETRLSGRVAQYIQKVLAALIDIPLDIATALLLSFFICIDYPNLRTGFRRLRGTWLRDVYDEIVPALANLGRLIGRALLAQGLIAACNATMIFIALSFLGVEHEVFLSVVTFVLCLIPTLGACIALVIIAAFALFQYGGGFGLAVKASLAVMGVLIMESFVLSPRILGRMMELHPVLIIALLPIAQYFFGVWGLILATPVAVYVINVIIFNRGLPGELQPKDRPNQAPLVGGQVRPT